MGKFAATKNAAYISLANDIASEAANTADHARRIELARQMSTLSPSFDAYVTVDLNTQGFGDATPMADMKNRIAALLTNLLALNYGGAPVTPPATIEQVITRVAAAEARVAALEARPVVAVAPNEEPLEA